MRTILEAPALKEGTKKELRRLHDTVQQHLRALKAMGHEPSGPFITSALELKLDANTMFEWQRHSQEHQDVPHFRELLDFINLRAQASEASAGDAGKKHPKSDSHCPPAKGNRTTTKPITMYATNTGATTTALSARTTNIRSMPGSMPAQGSKPCLTMIGCLL